MSQASTSEIINQICKESELFDSKDRLLNFSTKGDFQTPLTLEAGDLFYEKWMQSKGPLTLDSFLVESPTFTAQQKATAEDQFKQVFKGKSEDFIFSDLYLLLGFLKWDGNALAPSLLVPVDVNPQNNTLTISNRGPIENVILRKRLEDTIQLPRVEDATINGQFSILLYFSLFEKAIAMEKKWKFTRHGICLAFFNTSRLRLKKRLERSFSEKIANHSPFLNAFLGQDGFQFKESVFEEADFDQVFNPADHHFLYPTDSHTTKVTIDALDDQASAYAIQALPGTSKFKVAANIAAESIATGKRTLVVARRANTFQSFNEAFKPQFRSFDGPEREKIEADLRKERESFTDYYNAVNKDLESAQAPLSEVLKEFLQSPAVKTKFPDNVFQKAGEQDFGGYKTVRSILEQIVDLYFEQNGLAARKSFEMIKVPNLSDEDKTAIANDLNEASTRVEELKPVLEALESIGLFPTGIYLSGLSDIIDLIMKNFDENTPVYEGWELRSNNWSAYQDTLKSMPEAGDKWVRYRRQTSDVYVDNAVDENILSTREEFAESLKTTLKGLSDHYRGSRKRLLSLLKNPKSVTSDGQLLNLIDTLIEMQENKRVYKDTAVLGNHLLGKDWLFEKSNWVELNKKIQFLYDFRETRASSHNLDLLLQVLENWYDLKNLQPKFAEYFESVQALLAAVRRITKALGLDTPLESLVITKWQDQVKSWNENWSNLDIHLQLSDLFNELEKLGCSDLAGYVNNADAINRDVAKAYAHYWSGYQIQQATLKCPDLFSLSPKARYQKAKAYRGLLDQFCNLNFREAHALVEEKKDILSVLSLDQTFDFVDSDQFDLAIFMDADCITVAEALSTVFAAKKIVFIGDPHMPSIEAQPYDAYPDILPRHSAFFQENILAAALRRGIPTRELWFSSNYSEASLMRFANEKIYSGSIKQFPKSTRDKNKSEVIRIVPDKIMSIAKAAIQHAEKHPGQTLGIIAFHQARCFEIESAIKALITKDSPAARFFSQQNAQTRYYVKTPDRAVDKYRDTIIVCAEAEGNDKPAAERKIAVCTTLAKQDLQVYVSQSDMEKRKVSKSNLFWEWVDYLQKNLQITQPAPSANESNISGQVLEVLNAEKLSVEARYAPAGIAIGPVVIDANNANRFLAVIEDDCTTERFRESIEDRVYIRPLMLNQLGWKVLNLWLPFWYMANQDEKGNLVATLAIEQSVAPPPPEENEAEGEEESIESESGLNIEAYQVVHPKIEGTPHDKPIAELPAASIITQMKFYVDYEAPLHEELLLQRVLELHHVDRAGPMISQALNDAIKLGCQKQKFIKTGKFFYSTKNTAVKLRDRSMRPESERKFTYVAPEERALLPASMDEHTIKQTLGLLE